jgi:hypothetical protein
MVLILGFVFSAGALGRRQEEPSGAAGRTGELAIAVDLPDGTVFFIGSDEMLGVIPLSKGRFSGIRITPNKSKDSVKIKVSALTTAKKKLSEATCDEVRSWDSEDAGSYEAKENASLLLSGLARLGLPVFKVIIVRASGAPPGWGMPNSGRPASVKDSLARCDCEYPHARSIPGPNGGIGVGGIVSFPDAGKCVEISGCGQCCRTSTPVGLDLVPQQASMKPDQVNTAGWKEAWTNLVDDAEQTFTPSLPRLAGVEVELVVGNAGAAEDQLTLTVLNATGRTVAVVTQNVQTADCDQVMFVIPNGGVEVTPGQDYRLQLSGGTTFGWKYVVDGYSKGAATFNGKALLPGARSTFLFRTFGAK